MPIRKRAERLANVERLRVVAMLEIVAFHVSLVGHNTGTPMRLPVIAGLGLPLFLVLNNTFNCTLSERKGPRPFVKLKVSRLLLPWLFWCGVYASLRIARNLQNGTPLDLGFTSWTILGGTHVHLWFVPFALFGGLSVAWFQSRTRALPTRPIVIATLGLACALMIAGAWSIHERLLEWPLHQWSFAAPSVLVGIALGRITLANDRKLLVCVTGVFVAVSCLAIGFRHAVPEMIQRYAVSVAAIGIGFLWPGRADPITQKLSPLLLGVYLIHPLVANLYGATHLGRLPLGVFVVLVFGVSALIVSVIRRTALRWMV